MDNLTHSLAGALLAEATHDLAPSKEQKASRRSLLLVASIIANNFPDLDGIYTRIMPPPLGYLLHHRGHTHTILLLIPQLLLIFGILYLIPRFRNELNDRHTLKLTSIVVALGLLIHMMLDSWNSYGVHPFYPLSNRWFYGDLVFIIEPFLWFAFAVPTFFTFKSIWSRIPIALIISGVPLVAALNGLLTWYSVAAVFSFALITAFFAQRARSVSRKVLVGAVAATLFLITQGFTSSKVRSRIHEDFKPQSVQHKILDLVLNPMPANPFCWAVLQLEADPAKDSYTVEGKLLSSWPSLLPASSCVAFRDPTGRAELKLSEFKSVIERDCFVDAWLRFARAPMFQNSIAEDLRFDRGGGNNFTILEISSEKRDCPKFIPPWSKPRQDLVDLSKTIK